MAADKADYEFSSAWQKHAVWSQVELLSSGTARPAVLSRRAELSSARRATAVLK